MIDKLNSWHKTKAGYASFAVLELIVANLFASFAVDKGNLWDYLFAILFFVGSLQNVFKFGMCFKKVSHSKHAKYDK